MKLNQRAALVGAACLASGAAFTLAPVTAHAAPMCAGRAATIIGTTGDDVLMGTPGADVIVGISGNDTINAGGGNDLICVLGLAHVVNNSNGSLDGGPGIDTIAFTGVASFVGVDLGAGTAFAEDEVNVGEDVESVFARVTVAGVENATGGDSTSSLAGTNGDNFLDSGAGTGFFTPRGGNDSVINRSGLGGLNFSTSPVGIVIDLAQGTKSGGGSLLFSGNIQRVDGSKFNDTIRGTDKADIIFTGGGVDYVSAKGGDDTINVQGRATVKGGDGNDNIVAGRGNDTIDGGNGIDIVGFGSVTTGVTVSLAAGTATGGSGTDTLANIENVAGTDFADTLIGNSGANHLLGNDGNDTLRGGGGADLLEGLWGKDTIAGGLGSDSCWGNGAEMTDEDGFVDVATGCETGNVH